MGNWQVGRAALSTWGPAVEMPRAPVGMSVGGETAAAGPTTKTPGCWTALPARATAGQTPSHIRRQGSQMPLEGCYQPTGHTSRGSSRAVSSCCPSPRRNEKTFPTPRDHGPDTRLAGSEWDGRFRDEAASPGSALDPSRVWGWGGTWETAGLATTALRAPAWPLGYTGSLCTISDSWRVLTAWAHSLRTGKADNGHPPRTSPEGGRGSSQGLLRTPRDRTVLGVTVSSAISGSAP